MKNYFLLCVSLVLIAFFGQEALAQEPSNADIQEELGAIITNNENSGRSVTFTILAEVTVTDAMVWEQNGRDLIIEFDLKNEGSIEPEILYAVQLYRQTKVDGEVIGDTLVHEQVYPDVVSLGTDEVVHKQITYTAPNLFEGEYMVRILVANKQGFIYGGTSLGTYTFMGGSRYGEGFFDPRTCYLTIDGEEGKFSFLQGVDINTDTETLKIKCADTAFAYIESSNVQFTFRERSAFGDVATEKVISTGNIIKENGNFEIVVPVPSKPQAYHVRMNFVSVEDGSPVSSDVTFRVVAQGESATVKNVSYDKESYVSGDEAQIKIVATGYADVFPDARGNDAYVYDGDNVQPLLINAQVFSDGVACSDVEVLTLRVSESGLFEMSVPIIRDCDNPNVAVSIVNEENTVLSTVSHDERNEIKDIGPVESSETSSGILESVLKVVFILVFFTALGFFILRRNKKTDVLPMSVLLLTACFWGFGAHTASAVTFSINYVNINGDFLSYDGYYQLEDADIPCKASITGRAQMWLAGCGNTAVSAEIKIDGVSEYFHTHSKEEYSIDGFSIDSGLVTRNVGTKTTSGKVRFNFLISSNSYLDNQEQYANYTVGVCANFTPKIVSINGCARTDGTQSASVDVSITAPTLTPVEYQFKCGATGDWISLSESTYTCVFNTPGTKKIGYRIKVESNEVVDKYLDVKVPDCNPDFTPTASVTGCANPLNPLEQGVVGASITFPNTPVEQYGFKCDTQDWVYPTGNTYICKFSEPGEKNIKYSIKDTYGSPVHVEELTVTVNQCATDFTTLVGTGLVCAREGDDMNNSSIDVSIVDADLAITEYAFKCDTQDWATSPTESTHTCVFESPGSKTIITRITDINGNPRSKITYVTIPPCDVPFAYTTEVFGCATTDNDLENSTVKVTLSEDYIPIVKFGVDCGSGWQYSSEPASEATFECIFPDPNDKLITMSVEDALGSKSTDMVVVPIYPCSCLVTTGSVTIDGSEGNVDVVLGSPFNIGWSFASDNDTYVCSLKTHDRSSLADSTPVAWVGSVPDTINDIGDVSSVNYYTLSCTSGSCPTVNTSATAIISPPNFNVSLSVAPSTDLQVIEPSTWTVEVSGGVPFDVGDYEIKWTGEIISEGMYTNPDGTANTAIRYIDKQFSTLEDKTVTVFARDKWGNEKSDTLTVTVKDDRGPQ